MNEIELLGKLVSVNSVFPNENELAEFLEEQLKERGFAVRRVEADGRFCVVGDRDKIGTKRVKIGRPINRPAYKLY